MTATAPDTTTRRVFWLALLAIPIVFFALLEGGLRVAGYGEDTSLFAEVETDGVAYYVINPNVVRRYFGDPDFGTYTSRDRFRVEKQPETYRIFALGASTTVGFPYLFHGSFPSLLRDRLAAQFPERRVEVVNVGITAVNSYTVADLTRELMRYEPDLLLVYSGHNEFYGALGAGSTESLGGRRWMVRLYLTLQHSRIVQLLRDAMMVIGRSAAPASGEDGQQLMERMAREREIRYSGPLYENVREAYRANLEDVVRIAQRNGVDVVLSTLVSNLRSQPPFIPVHREGITEDQATRWRTAFEEARRAQVTGDCEGAVQHYRRAFEIDGARADAHFHLAQCLETMGDAPAAARAYATARDLDGLRFRASGEFSEVVRGLAAEHDVPLVEMEEIFAAESPAGIVGEELMTEHVHPTFDGYLLMARGFASAMAERGLFASRADWAAAGEPDAEYLRRLAGLTEFDHEVARLRIEQLTSRWPFRSDPVPFEFQPETLAQQFAWRYLNGQIAWGAARNELSRAYAHAGEDERSAEEFWALAKVTSYDPHYALLAADMHARGGRFERAAEMYRFALTIRQDPFTAARLGGALYELGEVAAAVPHLQRAVSMSTGRPLTAQQRAQTHLLLARAHADLGDRAAAEAQLAQVRALTQRSPAGGGGPLAPAAQR